MNLLDNLNINPEKVIVNENLWKYTGGGSDCCFIFCPEGVICGKNGTGGDCSDVPVEPGCSALPGSCANCSMVLE